MPLKGFFIILAVLLVGLFGLILYFAGATAPLYLYLVEGIIVFILFYLVFFIER